MANHNNQQTEPNLHHELIMAHLLNADAPIKTASETMALGRLVAKAWRYETGRGALDSMDESGGKRKWVVISGVAGANYWLVPRKDYDFFMDSGLGDVNTVHRDYLTDGFITVPRNG